MFHWRRMVQFHETDAAGIIHFTAFFTYMEEAEHAFLRSLGLSVMHSDAEGRVSWPRVAAECDFRSMVRFEDELDVIVSMERRGTKSVTYHFAFTHAGRDVADGRMTSVCCRLPADGLPYAIPIPEPFASRLPSE